MELPHDLAIPLLGVYLKKVETFPHKDVSTPMLTSALPTITKREQPSKCLLVDEWIEKTWHINTAEYY